jgi:hypothetical protein
MARRAPQLSCPNRPDWPEKALHVGLAHVTPARRHVVELAGLHPRFEHTHLLVQLLEIVHDEQQRLVVVDLEVLVDDPLELQRIALHGSLDTLCTISP